MKKFLILGLIPLLLMVPGTAFGEEYKILIPPGGTGSDCAENAGCIIPEILYVETNVEVFFEVDKNNGMVAFCWGTPDLGCTGNGAPAFQKGTTKSMTFTENGIYNYFDSVHPWLVGKIVVGLENPPEQDLSEIKENQEKSIEEFSDIQESKKIAYAEENIAQFKEIIKELDEKASELEFKILQMETGVDNLKYENGKYLEPKKDLEYHLSLNELKKSEQLELYLDELENHRKYLISYISDLEFELLELESRSQTEVDIKPESTTKVKDLSKVESNELGIASFVDKSKDPQHYIERYNKEPSYREWFHENYPQYNSIEQAVGLELTEKIPDWVKNIFGWYAADQVSEDELLNAIKYLINEGILIVE